MNDVVQVAAISEGITVRALLLQIAEKSQFTNADEVARSWWRRHRTNAGLFLKECELVRQYCEELNRKPLYVPPYLDQAPGEVIVYLAG